MEYRYRKVILEGDGYIIGIVVHGGVIRGLFRFETLAELEEHGWDILNFCKRIKGEDIPQSFINAFNKDGKG